MKKILLDSDILIEYLRGRFHVIQSVEHLMSSDAVLAISPITEAEIRCGLRSPEREKTERALLAFDCLEMTRKVGQRAGEYLRMYRRSHGMELADALIAATAFVHRFALATFNWKHFPMSEIDRYKI